MRKIDVQNIRLWPHLTIVAVICAVVSGLAVGWWVSREPSASAEALPDAARIQRVDGDVALNNSSSDNTTNSNWVAATPNQPFTVGDQIYTRENSHASLAFTGRNFARLDSNTSLDVISLSDQRTQLALRDGSAMFDVGYLAPGQLFEVATPYGAVDFQQPGLYNVGIDNGNVLVSVLSGLAQVVGLGGSGQVNKGEVLRLIGQTAADVVLSRIDGRDAGYQVDDYYSYQYPQYYDGRYRDYNTYLNDPYYFDPYRRTTSYQYVNSYIPGLYDLDYYGNWQNLNGYGYSWAPSVDSGWAPYQSGYWMTDYPYGPTWVSSEPWGYAPYHYGRWAYVDNRWYWVPDNVNNNPIYSPAMVAFMPFGQNEIGWVPLAPGDVYTPRYYNQEWQPYYFGNEGTTGRFANLYVPDAVAVLSIDDFHRGADWRGGRKADRRMLEGVNPILDPLRFTPLRNAVVNSAWGRGKKDLPPGIAKKLHDTTVITSTTPIAPPFRRDIATRMRVESVNDRSANRKFKVKDEREGKGARNSAQAPDQFRGNDREQNRGQARVAEREQPLRVDGRSTQPRAESDQRRVIERPQNRGQARRPESGTVRQQPVKVDRGRPTQPRPEGQRVGNRSQSPTFSRPRQPEVDKRSRVLVPPTQQPRTRQNSENPGRVRSPEVKAERQQQQPAPGRARAPEVKVERKQQQPAPAKPQSPDGAKGGGKPKKP